MSALEMAIDPILWPLINGEHINLRHLTDEQRILLGRWVAKTGYVLSQILPSEIQVPEMHLRTLYENSEGLPNGVYTLAACSTVPCPYRLMVCSTWPIVISDYIETEEDLAELIGASYKIVFQIGWLVFAIVYWASPGWNLGLFRGLHDPVWPTEGPFRELEGFAPQAVSESFYFDEMISSLAVFQNGLSPDEPITGPVQFIKGYT